MTRTLVADSDMGHFVLREADQTYCADAAILDAVHPDIVYVVEQASTIAIMLHFRKPNVPDVKQYIVNGQPILVNYKWIRPIGTYKQKTVNPRSVPRSVPRSASDCVLF